MGLFESILQELKARFKPFLDEALQNNPMKGEYFLPFVVDELLQEKKATVRVLKSEDKWYGVTYKEDKPMVMNADPESERSGTVSAEFMGGSIRWKTAIKYPK